ncbi:hypothetical protein ACFQ3R_13995 [Mesonia ostreae]|uniref:Uncharacterized protein n=1 Tax=Mesonia ostreae TaxID=861110 RepID=A0ABU2KGB0_9FLAO|nr:hypothetical protein [Mesonia ostreae]MDT0293693.1 hypothetical protein [Mesonia ostreae]
MFKTLNEYYDYIEKDNNFGLSSHLKSLSDDIETEEEMKKCSFEIYYLDFNFRKGIYIPLCSNNENSYSSKSLFEDFDYIKIRANSTDSVSSKHLAKYNHLLWESSYKHIDYRKLAIGNYFKFLKTTTLPKNDNLSQRGFSEMFENMFLLNQSINFQIDESIQFLIGNLKKKNISGFQKFSLMDFITNEGRKIDKQFFK